MNTLVKKANPVQLNWDHINSASITLAGIALLALIIQVIFAGITLALPQQTIEPSAVTVPIITQTHLDSLEAFQKKTEQRNLFLAVNQPPPAAKPLGILDKVRSLSLIGVIATGTPQAIIKDSQSNQSYFVKQGQKFRDLEVKQIKKGSIVLKYGAEEKEIFLA